MKLKKYLSVLVAVLILVSALPIGGIITSVSAKDADKIAAIKDAWVQLEKYVTEIQPSINGSHVAITPEFGYVTNTALLPSGVTADKTQVGEYYTKVTTPITGTANTEAGRGNDSAFLRYQSKADSLADYNVRVSFYIEQLNGTLEFVPFFRYGSTGGGHTGKLYSVKSTDVGKWVTLGSDDIKGTDWSKVVNIGNGLLLGINSTAANVFYIGCYIITEDVELPTGSEAWGLSDWIDAANELDLSKYYNTEALKAATAGEEDKDAEKIKEITDAWKQLEQLDFEVKPSDGPKNINVEQAASGDSSLLPNGVTTDKALLGSSYAKASFAAVTADESASSLGSSYIRYEAASNPITAEHNVYFSFYMPELKGNLSVVPFFRKSEGAGNDTGKKYQVKTTDVGSWVTLKSEDLKGSSWSLVTDLNNRIILGINSDTVGNVIYCGSFLFTKKVTLPSGSAGWGINEWRSAFAALDLTQYYNTEPLKKVFENDKEYAAIVELGNAWRQIEETAFALMPIEDKNALEQNFSLTGDSSLLPSGVSASNRILGPKYTKVEITAATATNSTEAELGSSWIKYQSTAADISNTNVYISFYLSELNGNLSIVPFFRKTGGNGANTGKEYKLTADDIGKWVTLKSDDLKGSGFSNLNNIGNNIILGVNSDTANTVYFGSFIFTKNLTPPEKSRSWSLGEWVVNAANLDLTDKLNTDGFKTALESATEVWKELGAVNYSAEALPEDLTELGENMLIGVTPEISYYNDDISQIISNENAADFADGKLDTSADFAESPIGEGKFIDVVYYFSSFVTKQKLLLAMPEGSTVGEYEVYSSNSRETLFAEANKVLTVKKDSFTENSHVLRLFASNTGSYLAYRFKEADEGILKLSELGVYGEKNAVLIDKGNFDNAKLNTFGKNLINGDSVKVKVNGNSTNITGLNPTSNITDGDVLTPYSLAAGSWNDGFDDSKTCDIYFDLGASHKINSFLYNSWYEELLETGKYDIYVSNSISELFLSSNRVLSYNNMYDSENGTTISQLFTFEESQKPVGRYVCFRVRCSVSNWEKAANKYAGLLYVRLTELGVYGERYTPPAKPINMLNHVPVDIYRTQNNERVKISDDTLSSEQIKRLGDGDYTVSVPLTTEGKQLDYVFNLCGAMKLDALNLIAQSASISSIKIYAADNADEIWEDTALVYTSNNTSEVSEIKYTPENQVAARYLRYSVVSSANQFDPVEFEAIGMDDQALTYRNLLLENPAALNLYSMDYNSGFFKILSETDNKFYASVNQRLSNITDGELSSVFDIYSAEAGKSSIDLVVDLGSLHAVDFLSLKAGSDNNHWPSEMNVYMHQNEDGVMAAESKIAHTFNQKAEDGIYEYDFSPQYVRYIRFQITKASHPYLKAHLMTVISELEVKGMAVSGRIAEDANAVLSFTDTATGIKVNILKNDDNDVFSGVSSIKVTPVSATLSEKQSLKDYSMMIYGPTKYIIKLFDRNGKEVTDIGGREIAIFFPIPQGEDAASIYVGSVENGAVAMMNTAIFEDKVSANFTDATKLTALIAGFVVTYPEGYFDGEEESDNSSSNTVTNNNSDINSETANENKLIDEKTGVAVIYQDGILPADASITVEKAGSEILPKILAKQLSEKDFAAYKIFFDSNGGAVEPAGMLKMVFPIPEGMQGDKCKVYFIAVDGKRIMDMNAELIGSELTFLSDKSGIYMITDKSFSVSGIREEIKGNGSGKQSGDIPYALIIGISAFTLVLVAAVVILILCLKKRNKNHK